jgi:tetratricopeptide (TPR) repeat protein
VLYRVDGHFAKSLKACSLLKLAQRKAFDNFEEDAFALRKEALAVSQDAYEHAVASSDGNVDAETIGRTLVYLSQAQTNLGNYRNGEESARRAITIFDKDYSGTHVTRRQGVAHMSLADAYMGQGRYEEARAAYLMAEEIFERISTHKAFDDMSELYEKLVALGLKMGDNVDARFLVEVYKERHAATFSMEHPRLVKIMANIMSANL